MTHYVLFEWTPIEYTLIGVYSSEELVREACELHMEQYNKPFEGQLEFYPVEIDARMSWTEWTAGPGKVVFSSYQNLEDE